MINLVVAHSRNICCNLCYAHLLDPEGGRLAALRTQHGFQDTMLEACPSRENLANRSCPVAYRVPITQASKDTSSVASNRMMELCAPLYRLCCDRANRSARASGLAVNCRSSCFAFNMSWSKLASRSASAGAMPLCSAWTRQRLAEARWWKASRRILSLDCSLLFFLIGALAAERL